MRSFETPPSSSRIIFAITVLSALITPNFVAAQDCVGFGAFIGTVQTDWLADGRRMRLLANFSYVSAKGRRWYAPVDSVVDGASIPRPLWSIIGSPFTGKYRNASVVHDVACAARLQPWQDVHEMFYDAMRCGGVDDIPAKVMWAGVNRFGPRWDSIFTPMKGSPEPSTPKPWNQAEFEKMRAYIERENPSLELIRRFK